MVWFSEVRWSWKTSHVKSNQWLLRLNEKFKICHISIVIAIQLCCFQFITLQNKCKVQSSTFSTGNPLIQVPQVKLVIILLGWLSKVLTCCLVCPWCNWCIRCISQCSTSCAQLWFCNLAFLPVF